jgi:hypothetical protein
MPKVSQSVVDQCTRRHEGRSRAPRELASAAAGLTSRSARGDCDCTTPAVKNLTGRPPRSFHDFASAYRNTRQARMPASQK